MFIIDCWESDVSGHDHLHPTLDRRPKWLQFHLIEPITTMRQHRHSQMGVYRRIPMPRKMLHSRDNPGLSQPLYCGKSKPRYQVRI
ncbi:hypothetical protein D3C74_328870 [compost metagenome]